MRLNEAGLSRVLDKPLLPLFWIDSDDEWLRLDALAKILGKAREQGFTERHRLNSKDGLDLNVLEGLSQNLSLFAEKKVLEIALDKELPPKLLDWLARVVQTSGEMLVIITSLRLDTRTQKAKWYQAIEPKSAMVTLWPIDAARYPEWLMRRAREKNVTLAPDALRMLATHTENNLFAADQLLEKLKILGDKGVVGHELVENLILFDARYQVYDLSSALLRGERERVLMILNRFEEEGEELLGLLGLMCREVRLLAKILREEAATSRAEVLRGLKLWEKRQIELTSALNRVDYHQCLNFLKGAALIDKSVKGILPHAPWQLFRAELVKLC